MPSMIYSLQDWIAGVIASADSCHYCDIAGGVSRAPITLGHPDTKMAAGNRLSLSRRTFFECIPGERI